MSFDLIIRYNNFLFIFLFLNLKRVYFIVDFVALLVTAGFFLLVLSDHTPRIVTPPSLIRDRLPNIKLATTKGTLRICIELLKPLF